MATENGAARFANAQECRSPGNHAVSNPVHQRVPIKGETYFRNPTLLALVAPPSTKRFLWSVAGVSPANAKYRFHSSACSANPVPNPTLPANRAPPWRIRSGPRAAAEMAPPRTTGRTPGSSGHPVSLDAPRLGHPRRSHPRRRLSQCTRRHPACIAQSEAKIRL